MVWLVVPNLEELRQQLNEHFPNRDKTSDGSIGDTSHAARASSHNPDKTGNPEYRDGDAKDEVRARDFDADLRDPAGVTAERVVQHLVEWARAGKLPHVRYIIFNKRIWSRSDWFKTHAYTGSNPHDKHFHVNSDFTSAADEARNVNWGLDVLVTPPTNTPAPTPIPSEAGYLKEGSIGTDVRRLQSFLRNTFPAYRHTVPFMQSKMLEIDGVFGGQTKAWVKEFQRRTSLTQDGVVGPETLTKLRGYGYKY